MKIRKNNKVVELTESEVKEIVNKYKITKFLNEDRESRRADDKKLKVGSIIVKLTTLSNMLKSTKYNLESISTLHKIEEFLEKQIEDFEDKIEGEHAKQLSKELK
jgi:Trp operon repressor